MLRSGSLCRCYATILLVIVFGRRLHLLSAGYEDANVSALLSVRFLPGYPYKCPKLQINLEEGLSNADADNLLSLLHDQMLKWGGRYREACFGLKIAVVEARKRGGMCVSESSSNDNWGDLAKVLGEFGPGGLNPLLKTKKRPLWILQGC
ncbi:non-specific serine,threonine protein kinase [Sarracenia purpurea var. burkii]